MSLYDYELARVLVRSDPPFYALVMAAMMRADTINYALLKATWPDVLVEVQARFDAPGGRLEGE